MPDLNPSETELQFPASRPALSALYRWREPGYKHILTTRQTLSAKN